MAKYLQLGHADIGKIPADKQKFFAVYHKYFGDALKDHKLKFRDDDYHQWRNFREVSPQVINHFKEILKGHNNYKNLDLNPEEPVKCLQAFLKVEGFMERAGERGFDGIYGYVTRSAIRLFQEYCRTSLHWNIGTPDGIAGEQTFTAIANWVREGKSFDWYVHGKKPSKEYKEWLEILKKYEEKPSPIQDAIEAYIKHDPYSTLKKKDWVVSDEVVHLVGIRRKSEESHHAHPNNDLFFLLIRGQVFIFWGSTDPSQAMANKGGFPRTDEAFLVEGQHIYTFGWHQVNSKTKISPALRPASLGVLIARDKNNNNSYSSLESPLESNTTINLHWSGKGISNWSAGCQVIAGSSYLNAKNEIINCDNFTASNSENLGKKAGKRYTRGAYNTFTDLVLCLSPKKATSIRYTLIKDDELFNISEYNDQQLENILLTLKSGKLKPTTRSGPTENTIQAPYSIKEKIKKILHVFETGTAKGKYDQVSVLRDRNNGKGSSTHQISYGVCQATERDSLPELLQLYVHKGGKYKHEVQNYLHRIGGDKPSLHKDEEFKDLLKKVAQDDPIMHETQEEFFDKKYYKRAENWFHKNGFTKPLSLLVIYDSYVHSWVIRKDIRNRFAAKPPAAGGQEKLWVTEYVKARDQWLTTRKNKLLQKTVYRTRCLMEQIENDNWDLKKEVNAHGTLIK